MQSLDDGSRRIARCLNSRENKCTLLAMREFEFTSLPLRVRFARGGRRFLKDEIAHLGRSRAMVVCTQQQREQAEEVRAILGDLSVGILDQATMHTPVEVTRAAMGALEKSGADCTVAVGGGSTIGLAKAIALRSDIPQIALPTTYAGSEMTTILGQTEGGVKTTLKDPRVLPASVIYDVDYTLTLSANTTACSGLNAIAHAIEALYAKEKNPITNMLCLDAVRALSEALPAIVEQPGDVAARCQAQYGAFLCGMALGSAGMALHHKLCHVLGGAFDLPHAETHSIILPHAAGFNAATAPELEPIRRILGSRSVGGGLYDFAARIGAPLALKDIGMPPEGIDLACNLAVANPYWNPRKFDRDDMKSIVSHAYEGTRPE